jgi:hypothetical protein
MRRAEQDGFSGGWVSLELAFYAEHMWRPRRWYARTALLHVRDFRRRGAKGFLRQRRFHEQIDVAVEHAASV